jgi:hypothetical protein
MDFFYYLECIGRFALVEYKVGGEEHEEGELVSCSVVHPE